jgi:hypothetical protein
LDADNGKTGCTKPLSLKSFHLQKRPSDARRSHGDKSAILQDGTIPVYPQGDAHSSFIGIEIELPGSIVFSISIAIEGPDLDDANGLREVLEG